LLFKKAEEIKPDDINIQRALMKAVKIEKSKALNKKSAYE